MGRRLALLVATYRYQDTGLRQLTAPAHDAEALAAVLRDPDVAGFEVTMLVNEPHYRVGEAIGDFYRDRRRDDLTLLYFTGHGLKDDDGQLYLAMTNTRRDSLLFTALSADQIDRAMEGCPSRQKVLVLDCCYSGAFPAARLAKADTSMHTLERFQGRGRTVLTASDATQYSFEGDQPHGEAARSVFTRYLVAGLRDGGADLDGDGDITVDELYSYVHDRVVEEMPQQRPKKQDNVEGRTVIARNVNWTLPAYLRNAISSPLATDRLSALDGLAHLVRIGNGHVRGRALEEIRRLADDDSKRVSTTATDRLRALLPPPDQPKAGAPPPDQPKAGATRADRPEAAPALEAAQTPQAAQASEAASLAQVSEPPTPEPTPDTTPPRPLLPDLSPRGAPTLRRLVPRTRRARVLTAGVAALVLGLAVALPISFRGDDSGGSSNDGPLQPRAVLTGTAKGSTALAFSGDGKTLATMNEGTIWLWNIGTGKPVTSRLSEDDSLALSPDGKTIAYTTNTYGTPALQLWNEAEKKFTNIEPFRPPASALAFSPDSTLLAVASSRMDADNRMALWDTTTGELKNNLGIANGIKTLAFSPDGTTLASGGSGQPVRLWNLITGKVRKSVSTGYDVFVAKFSPDGRSLATVSGKKPGDPVDVWNVVTDKNTATLIERSVIAHDVGFRRDGTALVAGITDDSTVIVLDIATGDTVRAFTGHTTPITSVAFSPDATTVAVGTEDGTVRLWNVP